MKIVRGWRRISNEGGFLNECTGQTLVVTKKEFGVQYHVLLFSGARTKDSEGKKVSPDFPTKPKAETFALNWMKRNPNGTS
jgi:hypothetical protein